MVLLILIICYPFIFFVVNSISQKVSEIRLMPKLFLLPLVIILLPGIVIGLAMNIVKSKSRSI